MSPAVHLLAEKYRTRRIGRSAAAVLDLILPFNDLLRAAGCLHGLARAEAERDFLAMEGHGLVQLERASRDDSAILKVRVKPGMEAAFFEHLGETAPRTARTDLAALFIAAGNAAVPLSCAESWLAFCRDCAQKAESGTSLAPCFDRADTTQTAQILAVLPRLLAWQGESFRRFASAVLFGNSKVLETLEPRLEACLARLGASTLADFGIRENPRSLILHGPLQLHLPDGEIDLGAFRTPLRIGADDLRAAHFGTTATRRLTVENPAMLHELAKFQSGTILASSGSEGGFAHAAILDFLRALPPEMELFHFGDSDPAGFDILRNLREQTCRAIASLHMRYLPAAVVVSLNKDDGKTIRRLLDSAHLTDAEKEVLRQIKSTGDKGAFEQESLGQPQAAWPFY